MMDYTQLIDTLVRELSYRVGVPNIHDKEHQSIMSEILSEWGEFEAKEIIFEFLTEKDDKIDPETEITYQNKKGETRKTTYKTAIASNQDSPQFKAADTLRNKKDKDGSTDKPSKGKIAGKKMFQHAPDINPNVGKDTSDEKIKTDTSTFEVGSKRSTEKIIKVNEKLSNNLKFIEENYDKVRLKTGGGSNSPSVQDVKDLKEFTEKRMAQDTRRKEALEKGEEFNEEPYVHPSIIQRNVTDDEVDTAMDYFEEKLETSDFGKLLKKFSAGGAVPRHLTKVTKLKKGDEGYPGIDKSSPGYIRAKKILKLYLKNDCKSPVTGNPLPLSHMEPDHRLPFTTAESDIVESGKYEGLSLKAKKPADGNSLQEIMKKRKEQLSEREQNIVKDLEPLQAKYDDPDTNMDLMAGPVNQFKSDLIDNDLLNSIRRKLAENPEEKILQNEYKTLRKKLIREHHSDKVSRGDNPPYNEYDIRNADSTETNAMMKAHNFYHPDAKTITELEGGDPSKGIPALSCS